MRSLSLQTQDVNPDRSSDGYVFFPKGTYAAIEVNLLNEETEESAARISSWETGEAQVPSTAIDQDILGNTHYSLSPITLEAPPVIQTCDAKIL
jgi:hypothetical protein